MEKNQGLQAGLSGGCVFVGGQPRSGTSLATSILNSSTELVQAYELHVRKPSFVVGLDGRYTENIFASLGLPRQTYREIIEQVLVDEEARANLALGAWAGPVDPISAEVSGEQKLADLEVTLRARLHVVELLMSALADIKGKSRWGFKVLTDATYADRLFGEFPDSKLVYLIRDPRDHGASILAMNAQRRAKAQPPFFTDERAVATAWVSAIQAVEELKQAFGDRVILLTYEHLVSSPEDSLELLSRQLRLDLTGWEGAHLDGSVKEHSKRFLHHNNLTKPITTSSVGKWRIQLTPGQVKDMTEIAGPTMARFGYL